MISVADAYQFITSHSKQFGTEKLPFLQTYNRILAQDVIADRDFPPFDRVMMDGIAISLDSFLQGERNFWIESEAAAGAAVQSLQNKNRCIEVMTGAVLPMNTNVVIPYEDCKIKDGSATVLVDVVARYQSVHRQASDEKKDAILFKKNTRITSSHISVFASVGLSNVEVYRFPTVAICSTGNELVPVNQTPLPHQIRQSNVYFMAADLQKENIVASLHHLRDDKEKMTEQLLSIIHNNDVVLLSGAVSKGKYDHLPETLTSIGFQTVFHCISQRPGKPFLLACKNDKTVFGFPGNPVSTFVCYHLFFKHWWQACFHQPLKITTAKLRHAVAIHATLTQHVLVQLNNHNGELFAEPIRTSTSGDAISFINADGIVSLSKEKNKGCKDEVVNVVLCR